MTACRFALVALVLTACRFALVVFAFSACEPRSMIQCRDYELGMTHVHARPDDAVKTPTGWVIQTESRGVEFWRSCTPCDCVRE